MTILGRVAPVLILAIITRGNSAALEGSEETAAIAEEIGGAKGTIKRQAVQMIDQGEVESDASQVDTVKGEAENSSYHNEQYIPDSTLPRDARTREPIPSTNKPHTQLGSKISRRGGRYRQAREWGYDDSGKLVPKKDIDFTDHGRSSEHLNPHQHKYISNETGGTLRRGKAEPLRNG